MSFSLFYLFSPLSPLHSNASRLIHCQPFLSLVWLISETFDYSPWRKLRNNARLSFFHSLDEWTCCWEEEEEEEEWGWWWNSHALTLPLRVFIFFHLPASMTCSLFCFLFITSTIPINVAIIRALLLWWWVNAFIPLQSPSSSLASLENWSNNRLIKRTSHIRQFYLFDSMWAEKENE